MEMFKPAERTAAIKVYNLMEDHPVVVSSTHEAIQPGDSFARSKASLSAPMLK